MPIDKRSDAAAAAAARARAEEARERAAQIARQAAEAARAVAAAAHKAQPQAKPVAADELSTGRGGALRRDATTRLAATGLPIVAKLDAGSAPTASALPTFRLKDGPPRLDFGGDLPPQALTASDEPGDALRPVDPKDQDAVAKAEAKLDHALTANQGVNYQDPHDYYAAALNTQRRALDGNPAAQKELVDQQQANIESVVANDPTNAQSVGIAFQAAQIAGPEAVEKLATKFAEVSTGMNADIVAAGLTPEAAATVAEALTVAGKTDQATAFIGRATREIDNAAAAAKSANDKVSELHGVLEKELDRVGPALTPEQKNDYEEKFWADHKAEVDEQSAANGELKEALGENLEGLKALAANNPEAAKSLTGVLGELGRDPGQAQYVSDTIDSLKTSAGAFPPGYAAEESNLVEIKSKAISTLANASLAKGDAEGAEEQLEKLQVFLESTTFASKDVKDVAAATLPELKRFTAVISDALHTNDYSKITKFLSDPEEASKLNKLGGDSELGKSVGNIAKGIGVAVYLTRAAVASDGQDQTLAVLHATKDGAELLADGFGAVASATREATNLALRAGGEGAALIKKALEHLNPVIGLGVTVVQSAASITDAIDDPSIRSLSAAVGDSISAAGAGIAMVPGGQVVGAAVFAAGTAVRLVGFIVQGAVDDADQAAERKKLLGEVLDDSANDSFNPLAQLTEEQRQNAAARIASSGADLAQIAEQGNLNPAQMVELAADCPAIGIENKTPLNDLVRLSGLKGSDLVSYLRTLSRETDLPNTLQSLEVKDTSQVYGNRDRAQQTALNEAQLYGHLGDPRWISQRTEQLYDENVSADLRGAGLLP